MIGGRPGRDLGHAVEPDRVDVGAVDVDLAVGEVGPDEGDRLLHPIDADAGGLPRHTHRLVLALQPAGAEADLEATLGEVGERRQFLREHHGLAVVRTEHPGPDGDRAGRFDGHGHGGDRSNVLHGVVGRGQRRPRADHMVGDAERTEAQGFCVAGLVTPVLGAGGIEALQPETERTRHRRAPMSR